jgi:hypothetical protein
MGPSPTPLRTVELELFRRGIRQTDVAARYPCSPYWINRIVRGWAPAPARFRELVVELTGLPERELFDDQAATAGSAP